MWLCSNIPSPNFIPCSVERPETPTSWGSWVFSFQTRAVPRRIFHLAGLALVSV